MDSQDHWVLSRVCEWLQSGRTVWFCTIIETVGASPRPVGSLLALNDAGELAGSLSGGCVEDDLLEKLRSGTGDQHSPQVIGYGITAEENERLGLPCGGRLKVLVEHCRPDAYPHFHPLLAALSERRCMTRTVSLRDGAVTLQATAAWQPLHWQHDVVTHTFGPQYLLLLVGAGELARVLSQMALMMDYRVLVCDPRHERIQQWSLPDVPAIQGMPDDIVREHACDSHSIVITLTHDPRIDDMALMEALQADLFYVGALGSIRTSTARRERLLQLGLTELQLARLHAPVGLPIHSKRPAEIAVAILAELTALRGQR
ncbi:MAG: XdhC family protein [Gammaproteobacteria bacterium]|nr:MAG: XdhC family protein [Gammaproteobacteria bacterium]